VSGYLSGFPEATTPELDAHYYHHFGGSPSSTPPHHSCPEGQCPHPELPSPAPEPVTYVTEVSAPGLGDGGIQRLHNRMLQPELEAGA